MLGKDHPDVAKTGRNIAKISAHGAFSSRRRRLLHSVVHSFSFSPSPLAFATPPFFSCNNLKKTKIFQEQALDQHSRAFEISIQVLGQDHPHVATSKFNSDVLQNEHGEIDVARELLAGILLHAEHI